MTCTLETKGCFGKHPTTMVIDKIRKMSVKGVKLKSESYFSISPGVLELWRKNLRGADSAPPVQIGLTLFDMGFFELSVMGGGGGHEGPPS